MSKTNDWVNWSHVSAFKDGYKSSSCLNIQIFRCKTIFQYIQLYSFFSQKRLWPSVKIMQDIKYVLETVFPTPVFKGVCSTLWMGPQRLWRTTCVTRNTCLWGRGQIGCPVPTSACWETGACGPTAAWWGFNQIKNTNIRLLLITPTLIPLTWQKYFLWNYEELVLQTWIIVLLLKRGWNIHSKHETSNFHLGKY